MQANEMMKKIDGYLDYKNIKKTSERKARVVFDKFFEFAGDQDITHDLMRRWRISMNKADLSQHTVKQYFGTVSGFFEYLLEDDLSGFTGKNYAKIVMKDIRPGERQAPVKSHFTLDEIRKILNKIYNPRDRAIITLLFKTGMRNEECRHIRVQDINFDTKILMICNDDMGRKGKKGTKKVTPFPMDEEVIERLKKWIQIRGKIDSPYLFVSYLGKDMSTTSLADIFKKYTDHESHPHQGRHTFTTLLTNGGCPETIIAHLRGDSKNGRSMVAYYDHSCDDFEKVRSEYLKAMPRFIVGD